MTAPTRVYLRRLDAAGSRFGALDVSIAVDVVVALRTAESWPAIDAPSANEGERARVTLTLSLNAGVTVPQGSIVSMPVFTAIKFRTLAAATNGGGSPATVSVEAEAVQPGPVAAAAGTLTVIDTTVSGWTAVTNAAAATPGRWPLLRSANPPSSGFVSGRHDSAPPPSVIAEYWEVMNLREARRRAQYNRLLPLGGTPPSATPSWAFQVRWFQEEPVAEYVGGDPLWREPPPRAPVYFPYEPVDSSLRATRMRGRPGFGDTMPTTWAAPCTVTRADYVAVGAQVWVDLGSIDGETQGTGRGWVPATVTGYGDEVIFTDGAVPTTRRAARIPVEQLPPNAAALVRNGVAVDRGLRATLLDPAADSASFTFSFVGDNPADIAAYAIPVGTDGTIADIAATSTLPRWTSRISVTLVELDPTGSPGIFTAK